MKPKGTGKSSPASSGRRVGRSAITGRFVAKYESKTLKSFTKNVLGSFQHSKTRKIRSASPAGDLNTTSGPTIIVTDAAGKSVSVGQVSEESRVMMREIIDEHREAFVRLADR